jgi:N-acetylglucosaminyl-diphospho-decaprenol L-rhamnosyltransferase
VPRTVVLIPSYNSWSNLEQHLPALLAEVGPLGVEVVVSDDASPDGSADRIEAAFPGVRVLRRGTNGGFGENCNSAIAQLDGFERVLLLNADVRVRPGFLQPLEAALDGDVFAVSSVSVDDEGRVEDGARFGRLVRGLLRWRALDLEALTEPHPSFYAVGAHVLFDRSRFLALGGFDPLYRPYYWEDADLGYRAWKRGWRVLVEPASRVEHRREGSDIRRAHGEEAVARVILRNRFLFLWANLHDPRLWWWGHVLPVSLRFLTGWLRLDRRFYRALLAALGRRGEAVRARRRNKAEAIRGDREVLAELSAALERHVTRR